MVKIHSDTAQPLYSSNDTIKLLVNGWSHHSQQYSASYISNSHHHHQHVHTGSTSRTMPILCKLSIPPHDYL